MKSWIGGVGVCALLVGCGASETSGGAASNPEGLARSERVAPVPMSQLPSKLANNGVVEFRPSDGEPFMAFRINATNFQRHDLAVAYQRAEGGVTAYFPVEPDVPEYPFLSASALLDAPATAVWIAAPEGAASFEHLSVTFYKEIPADGILATHRDDYELAADAGQVPLTELEMLDQYLTITQALGARYIPSRAALERGNAFTREYEDAPRWDKSKCASWHKPGTLMLGEFLVKKFPGATHFQGYECRASTSGSGKMSVHGTGKAIDLFIDVVAGDADNSAGDPPANWLIANSRDVGIQYLIWDQTDWGPHRGGEKHAFYSDGSDKKSPHIDHIHLELTSDAAERETPFFMNMSSVPDTSGDGSVPTDQVDVVDFDETSCRSSTLGFRVPVGTCVQSNQSKGGQRCKWFKCGDDGKFAAATETTCEGTRHENASCAPGATDNAQASGRACHSATLGRKVEHGGCVQVEAERDGCQACGWWMCQDGEWSCTEGMMCVGELNPSASCEPGPDEPAPEPDAQLEVRVEWTAKTDIDLFLELPGVQGQAPVVISYRNESALGGERDSEESCTSGAGAGQPAEDPRCDNPPFNEKIVWATEAPPVGTYKVWVDNAKGLQVDSSPIQVELAVTRRGERVDVASTLSVGEGRGDESERVTFQISE